jgi:hypothetical protein
LIVLRVYDILDNSEVQCSVRYCWYDYDASERIEIAEAEARGLEVKYLYIEDGELWIEVDREVSE